MYLWEIISENSDTLNVVINFLILLVWACYFQLLLNSHWEQKRAKILINRGAGHEINANCLISNMSAEPIYLASVVVVIDPDGNPLQRSLTDLNSLAKRPDSDPRASWFQGPIAKGDFINIGSFQSLLEHVLIGDGEVRMDVPEGRDLPSDMVSRDASHEQTEPTELAKPATRPFDAPPPDARMPDSSAGGGMERQSGDEITSVDQVRAFDIMVIAIYGPEKYPVAAKRAFRFDRDQPDGKHWQASESRQITRRSERRRLSTNPN